MLETRPGLPINELILFQCDSILPQFCQDFEPWKSFRTLVGVLDPVTKTVTSSAVVGAEVRTSTGCRAWAKNGKSCEERNLWEVGKLAVLGHFFGQKGSGDVALTNGDKLGGMDLGSFFGPKTEIERSVWSLFSAENEQIERLRRLTCRLTEKSELFGNSGSWQF